MSREGASVAEGEVHQLVAVEVFDERTVRAAKTEWKVARPLVHPRHGHASEEMFGFFMQFEGSRVLTAVATPLIGRQGRQMVPI
jgi:hypothetical protein